MSENGLSFVSGLDLADNRSVLRSSQHHNSDTDLPEMVLEEEDFVIAREEHGHLLYEKTFSSPTYCTICNGFIWGLRKQGLACELCGMVLHDKCKAKAEEKPCYSPEFVPNDQSEVLFLHHWVEVNTRGKCIVCSKSKLANNNSTTPSGFINARCIGCSKYVHLNCLPAHKDHGTGGYCTPTHRNLFLVSEIPMTIPTYKPLLVFINAKSGGQQGLHVLRALRGLLTRNQVISLLDESPVGPRNALLKYGEIPGLHILVCGGDGTVGWVLQELLDKNDIISGDQIPPIAVLPLGTGNDLARVLNWGGGYTGERLGPILAGVESASIVKLDRWKAEITFKDPNKPKQTLVFNNYLSIGLDAQIALQFHNSRENNPSFFKSRTINKGVYGVFGIQKLIDQPPLLKDLGVQLSINDQPIPTDKTDKLQCLVWSNIASYAGGLTLWRNSKKSQYAPSAMDDGLLEVIGIRSIRHVLALQTKIKHGLKIGQGNTFSLTIGTDCIIQVDGEPLSVGACELRVTHLNVATMLKQRL